MNYYVLVVDDQRSAAESYVELVMIRTKLNSIATDSPKKALDIVRTNPIAIAVLDQRMPKGRGTELFGEIKAIDNRIRAIMLTGEATADEVGDALQLGFSNYLHKSQVEKLPSYVLTEYAKYHAELAASSSAGGTRTLISERRGLVIGHRVFIDLLAVDVLKEEYIPPDSWTTIKQLRAGEKSKEEDSFQVTKRYIHEAESRRELVSAVGGGYAAVAKFQSHLEAHLSDMFRESIFSEARQKVSVVREYELPNPGGSGEAYVVSRSYQRAPVYRLLRCTAVQGCGCCGALSPVVVSVQQLTSKVATRMIDYLSNHEKREIATGINQF